MHFATISKRTRAGPGGREAAVRIELTNKGFADLPLSHLGTPPWPAFSVRTEPLCATTGDSDALAAATPAGSPWPGRGAASPRAVAGTPAGSRQ